MSIEVSQANTTSTPTYVPHTHHWPNVVSPLAWSRELTNYVITG